MPEHLPLRGTPDTITGSCSCCGRALSLLWTDFPSATLLSGLLNRPTSRLSSTSRGKRDAHAERKLLLAEIRNRFGA